MRQIRNLFQRSLEAGDRLPPERVLAERFGVGRRTRARGAAPNGVLRRAADLSTERYGCRQPGRRRAGAPDFQFARSGSGMTSRRLSRRARFLRFTPQSSRRTASDGGLDCGPAGGARRISERGRSAVRTGVEEDLLFHLAVANATGNPVLSSLIGLITPDVMRANKGARVCEAGRARAALAEHEALLAAITARDPKAALLAMSAHMHMTQEQFVGLMVAPKGTQRSRKRA